MVVWVADRADGLATVAPPTSRLFHLFDRTFKGKGDEGKINLLGLCGSPSLAIFVMLFQHFLWEFN